MRVMTIRGYAAVAAVLAAGLLAAVSGCATARIELPRFDVAIDAAGATPSVAGARVEVEPFGLQTAHRDATELGAGYSGVSKQPAPIHLAERVDAFLERTMRESLRSAGVESAPRAAADAVLTGSVEKFSVDERVAEWGMEFSAAEVAFRAAITDRVGAVLWSADLQGHAESARLPDASGRNRATLEQAVREAVEAMLRDASFWQAIAAAAASSPHSGASEAF